MIAVLSACILLTCNLERESRNSLLADELSSDGGSNDGGDIEDESIVCGIDLSASNYCWENYCDENPYAEGCEIAEEDYDDYYEPDCEDEDIITTLQCVSDYFECDTKTGISTDPSMVEITECISESYYYDDNDYDDDDDYECVSGYSLSLGDMGGTTPTHKSCKSGRDCISWSCIINNDTGNGICMDACPIGDECDFEEECIYYDGVHVCTPTDVCE